MTTTQPRQYSKDEPRLAQGNTHVDDLLDEALADTFPASDPISNLVPDTPAQNHASAHEDSAHEKDRRER